MRKKRFLSFGHKDVITETKFSKFFHEKMNTETYNLVSTNQTLINQIRFQHKLQDSKRHFKQVAKNTLNDLLLKRS